MVRRALEKMSEIEEKSTPESYHDAVKYKWRSVTSKYVPRILRISWSGTSGTVEILIVPFSSNVTTVTEF